MESYKYVCLMIICNYDKDIPAYIFWKQQHKAMVYRNNGKNNILKIY